MTDTKPSKMSELVYITNVLGTVAALAHGILSMYNGHATRCLLYLTSRVDPRILVEGLPCFDSATQRIAYIISGTELLQPNAAAPTSPHHAAFTSIHFRDFCRVDPGKWGTGEPPQCRKSCTVVSRLAMLANLLRRAPTSLQRR